MSAHLTAEQIEYYQQRSLAPLELLSVDDHLVACKACRQKLCDEVQPQPIIASLRASLTEAGDTTEHLSYKELAAFVDDELNGTDRPIVLEHLDACAQCRAEMQDLATFKITLVPLSDDEPARPATITLRARVANFFHSLTSLSALRLSSAVAVLLLIIAGVIIWLALRQARTSQVAVNEHPQVTNVVARPTPDTTPSSNLQQTTTNGSAPEPQPTPAKIATPTPSAEVVVALNDGGKRITLDEKGQLAGMESLSTAEQSAIKSALKTQRVETERAFAGLTGYNGGLMGGPSEGVTFALHTPVGTVVRTDRPLFSWQALTGAKSYVVTVYDADYNKVLTSPPLSVTRWTAPQALRRGSRYWWQVTAMTSDREIVSPAPPVPEARFIVLTETQAHELNRAEQAARNSHLARGVLYVRMGLLDEAEREFQALKAENPRSPVARKLLLNVRRLISKRWPTELLQPSH